MRIRTARQRTPLPPAFWRLWAGYLANRLGLLAPAFLALYLGRQHLASDAAVSIVIGLYGVGQLAARLIGGVLADRIGARAAIAVSQALLVVASAGLMVSRPLPVVCVFALACGVFAGIHTPAAYGLTYLMIAPDERAHAYGRLYWANNIGSAISTLLSGLLLAWWPPSLFLLAIAGAVVYLIVALTLPQIAIPAERPSANALVAALAPFGTRIIGPFLVLSLLLSCVYMQKQAALPLDLVARGLTTGQFGALLSLSAVIIVVLQPLAARLTRSLPQATVIASGACLIGTGFGLNAFVRSLAGYAFAVALWSLGEILYSPSAAAFMAKHSLPENVGADQGAYAFTWTLGLTVGAPLGQLLLTAAGSGVLWSCCLLLGLAVGAAHLVAAQRRAQRVAGPATTR